MIAEELKNYNNWVLWKKIKKVSQDKPVKMPFNIDGSLADTTDSKTWTSFNDALEMYKKGGYNGIGFVFSKDDPFVGIDIDDCISEKGIINDDAIKIIKDFNSYTEVSQSKRGLHIIIRGKKTGNKCRKGQFEVYDNNRYFALTGIQLTNTPSTVEARQVTLNWLYGKVFGEAKQKKIEGCTRSTITNLDELAIIEKIEKSHLGSEFKKLYDGDYSNFTRIVIDQDVKRKAGEPPKTKVINDHSAGDYSLCRMIAYYTQDVNVIDSIFRRSGLIRGKWDSGGYGTKTINNAIKSLTKYYDPSYRSIKRGK